MPGLLSAGPWAQPRPPTGNGCAASELDMVLSLKLGPPKGVESLQMLCDVFTRATDVVSLQQGITGHHFPTWFVWRRRWEQDEFGDRGLSLSRAGNASGRRVPPSLWGQASPGLCSEGLSGTLTQQPLLPKSGAAGSQMSSKCHEGSHQSDEEVTAKTRSEGPHLVLGIQQGNTEWDPTSGWSEPGAETCGAAAPEPLPPTVFPLSRLRPLPWGLPGGAPCLYAAMSTQRCSFCPSSASLGLAGHSLLRLGCRPVGGAVVGSVGLHLWASGFHRDVRTVCRLSGRGLRVWNICLQSEILRGGNQTSPRAALEMRLPGTLRVKPLR
uniref:Uncharacterized protein n=1 Tax=Rangifer tarandus platyrhynchus TaxID=3082113 RepID=A0ACB0FDT8_RANTA|nr:unnamed protein product [Rangifer tarandus platyrhynchus]